MVDAATAMKTDAPSGLAKKMTSKADASSGTAVGSDQMRRPAWFGVPAASDGSYVPNLLSREEEDRRMAGALAAMEYAFGE